MSCPGISVKKPLFLYYEPERQSCVMYVRNAKPISDNNSVFCGARDWAVSAFSDGVNGLPCSHRRDLSRGAENR
jgi:hypothetical protein